jgi:hypothetical protein
MLFLLLDVEPLGVPPLQRCVKWDGDVFTHHPVLQLQISTADHLRATPPFDFVAEEVAKQIEMGEDPQVQLQKFIKIEACKIEFGFRLQRLMP